MEPAHLYGDAVSCVRYPDTYLLLLDLEPCVTHVRRALVDVQPRIRASYAELFTDTNETLGFCRSPTFWWKVERVTWGRLDVELPSSSLAVMIGSGPLLP